MSQKQEDTETTIKPKALLASSLAIRSARFPRVEMTGVAPLSTTAQAKLPASTPGLT